MYVCLCVCDLSVCVNFCSGMWKYFVFVCSVFLVVKMSNWRFHVGWTVIASNPAAASALLFLFNELFLWLSYRSFIWMNWSFRVFCTALCKSIPSIKVFKLSHCNLQISVYVLRVLMCKLCVFVKWKENHTVYFFFANKNLKSMYCICFQLL